MLMQDSKVLPELTNCFDFASLDRFGRAKSALKREH